VLLGRGEKPHRYVDEAEGDRALPDRTHDDAPSRTAVTGKSTVAGQSESTRRRPRTARLRIRRLGACRRRSQGMTSAATTGRLICAASSARPQRAGLADRRVRRPGGQVGPGLQPAAQLGAARGDRQVLALGQQAPRPAATSPSRATRHRPAAGQPQRLAVHLLGRREQDERLEPADPGGEQGRDVPVAPELPQQRLRPPQLQVRLAGQSWTACAANSGRPAGTGRPPRRPAGPAPPPPRPAATRRRRRAAAAGTGRRPRPGRRRRRPARRGPTPPGSTTPPWPG
jgi:hypothetical protein